MAKRSAKKVSVKKTAPSAPKPKDPVSPEELLNELGDEAPGTDEPSHVDFDALDRMAEEVMLSPNAPRARANYEGDDGGDPYVRMINCTGHIAAVSYRLVPDRMMDGYRFMADQPVVPIVKTPQGETPDAPAGMFDDGYEPQARPTGEATSPRKALMMWLGEMRKDLQVHRSNPHLYWEYMTEVSNAIVGLSNQG